MVYYYLHALCLIALPIWLFAQEPGSEDLNTNLALQQYIEDHCSNTGSENDFSSLTDELEELRGRPVNLNSNKPDELRRLFLLNEIQILNLLDYTSTTGILASIFELQWIEGFNQEFIEMILPYITLESAPILPVNPVQAFRRGRSRISIRYQRTLEKQAGFHPITDSLNIPDSNAQFLGSPDAIAFKYLFRFQDRMQLGFVGEKDAGEPFLLRSNASSKGFDYYSFHLSLQEAGKHIRSLVVGDYHLQFGQGLTLWTGLAMSKLPGMLPTRRRPSGLKPHASSNEYAYQRGVATTIRFGRVEGTLFVSQCRRDANQTIIDTLSLITSIIETGYHRTLSEMLDRKILRERMAGVNLKYSGIHFRPGITYYHLEYDRSADDEPRAYEIFKPPHGPADVTGADYAFSFKRLTLYGEVSWRIGYGCALLQGLNFSPSPFLSIAAIMRDYPKTYLNPLSGAFGENGENTNERGIYLGLLTSPVAKFSMIASADLYSFPWLKYRVDAPSAGHEYTVQLKYLLNRNTEFTGRFRAKISYENSALRNDHLNELSVIRKNTIQIQARYTVGTALSFVNRLVFEQRESGIEKYETGFLFSHDMVFSPPMKSWALTLRYAQFDTESYDSRVYVYENSLPGTFSAPSFHGTGSRFFGLFKISVSEWLDLWIRISCTLYDGQSTIGDGNTLISGNHKSDIQFMIQFRF